MSDKRGDRREEQQTCDCIECYNLVRWWSMMSEQRPWMMMDVGVVVEVDVEVVALRAVRSMRIACVPCALRTQSLRAQENIKESQHDASKTYVQSLNLMEYRYTGINITTHHIPHNTACTTPPSTPHRITPTPSNHPPPPPHITCSTPIPFDLV